KQFDEGFPGAKSGPVEARSPTPHLSPGLQHELTFPAAVTDGARANSATRLPSCAHRLFVTVPQSRLPTFSAMSGAPRHRPFLLASVSGVARRSPNGRRRSCTVGR